MAFALSKNWLLEEYNVACSVEELSSKLTSAGLEVDGVEHQEPLAKSFIVGEIVTVNKHPQADKLSICQVKISDLDIIQIVCGCSTVAAGIKVAVATVGSLMPNGLEIKSCKLRGELSNGMLCSASELGFKDDSRGILHLAADAKIGASLADYFSQSRDDILQVEITPNRGDCLSVLGLAREIKSMDSVKIKHDFLAYDFQYNNLPIKLLAADGCSVYEALKLTDLDLTRKTPDWILNRLALFGQNSVNLFVDIVNYVMFELGQPMHGFDASNVNGTIVVDWAESKVVTLLNEAEILLCGEDLVIRDTDGVLALAGIMGTNKALIDCSTTSVILEAACFDHNVIARSCRKSSLSSDSAYRFERGVDRNLTSIALKRVVDLLQQCTTCKVVGDVSIKAKVAERSILLTKDDVDKILGIDVSKEFIEKVLSSIGCEYTYTDRWLVTPPSYRYDLNITVDLVEEILRFIGFEALGEIRENFSYSEKSNFSNDKEHLLRFNMSKLGLCEHIGYSFVAAKQQQQMFDVKEKEVVDLLNPLSSDMGQMRVSCWPGLLEVAKYNINRQCDNVRLFELGKCFYSFDGKVVENSKLSGLLYGKVSPLQWGIESKDIDFYDVKGLSEYILGQAKIFDYKIVKSSGMLAKALHPGQSADIYVNNEKIGTFGMLHPRLQRKHKVLKPLALFEFEQSKVLPSDKIKIEALSKFPSIRRDVALVVDESLSYSYVEENIVLFGSSYIKDFKLFDVYLGGKLPENKKSVALAFNFQSMDATLSDDLINKELDLLLGYLKGKFSFTIREF